MKQVVMHIGFINLMVQGVWHIVSPIWWTYMPIAVCLVPFQQFHCFKVISRVVSFSCFTASSIIILLELVLGC